MRVKDLYHSVVVTADAGESLASAAGRMVVHGIGSRAVLSDGQFAGIVTERDLARAVADDADTAVTPVGYYLSVAPASATQEDVQEVAGRMLEPGMRPLPGHRRGHARDQEDLRDAMRAPPQPVMGRVLVAVRRHPLAAYFLLAYAFSWGYWLPLALTGGHLSHFPGLLGPMLAALVVTPIVQGRAGLRDLLSRMGRWRVPLRWYVVASVPVVAGVLALGGLWVARGDMPSLAQLSTMPGLPAVGWVGVFILALVVNGYGEETGWRGVAWPRLRERHSLGGAALLLALPWAIWHAPTFWLDTEMRGSPMLLLPGFFMRHYGARKSR